MSRWEGDPSIQHDRPMTVPPEPRPHDHKSKRAPKRPFQIRCLAG
jgi:hypothetical protein